ncbi:MAG: peroxiredoxin [Bacteroidales bacterium]
MKKIVTSLMVLLGMTSMTAQIKVGDKAPAFRGEDQNGRVIDSKMLHGKKYVLYFYPKDNTPGCTSQACSFRDNFDELKEKGYSIIGVSADNKKSHAKFSSEYNLPFPILADTSKTIIETYGVKGMITKRKTFVVNEKGVVTQIIEGVSAKEHPMQILNSK